MNGGLVARPSKRLNLTGIAQFFVVARDRGGLRIFVERVLVFAMHQEGNAI